MRDVSELEQSNYKVKHNLTKEHLACVQDLALDKDLILKPTDKGGGIVLLDTEVYIQEAYRQLNNSSSYSRISHDSTNSLNY